MRTPRAVIKIMFALLADRCLNKYQIAKKTRLSYSRVHEGVQSLEKDGIVKITVAEKARTGLDKKKYSLTLKGFSCVDKILQVASPKTKTGTPEQKSAIKQALEELFGISLKISDLDSFIRERFKENYPFIAEKLDFLERRAGIPFSLRYWLRMKESNEPAEQTWIEDELKDLLLALAQGTSDKLVKMVKILGEDLYLRKIIPQILKEISDHGRLLTKNSEKALKILDT